MKLIETVTVGAGGTANITFSNIPATYTDLICKMNLRETQSGEAIAVSFQLNSSAPSTYKTLVGNGSSASAPAYYVLVSGSTATANTFGNAELYISNYTSSINKSASFDFVTETNSANGFNGIAATLFTVTSAVTSLAIVASTSFAQYSTASLYGILKGSGGATAA